MNPLPQGCGQAVRERSRKGFSEQVKLGLGLEG